MIGRTPLLNGIAPPDHSFVLAEHKIVHISVTKAACTALRWMLAALAGEDFERFYRAPEPHQTRLQTIHTARTTWQHVPRLKDVAPEVIAGISRDDGWFIFAVVRDPWTRLWSAWQSKLLVRHAGYRRAYGNEPWFPRVPEKPEDVLEDWRAFVEAAPWGTNPRLSNDVHFLPQVRTVLPEGVNYTRVYDLREMSRLLADLQAHLDSVGKAQPLYLPRANVSPLSVTTGVFADGVADTIRAAFAPDFEVFHNHGWDLADVRTAGGWSLDAIKAVAFETLANERIGDLSRELRATRRRAGQQVTVARPVASTVQRGSLTSRLRGVSDGWCARRDSNP